MHTQPERVSMRAARLLATEYDSIVCRTDRMFAYLLLGQWVSAMVFVFLDSPMTWSGTEQRVHPHVLVAVGLGGLVTVVPSFLALARPGEKSTRYVLATAQMVWSGIFIHLGGGRVEFHFHVFGSLAFLSFYRDYRVLIPATLVTAADHFIRGIFLPESIYGIPNAQWWRAFEHSGWVVFINIFLVRNCIVAKQDLVRLCSRQASMEASQRALRGLAEGLETRVSDRTLELETAMMALEQSQADVVERREREKHSLEKSRAGLLQFLNELPMGVIIVTRAGTTYLVNDRARVILGDTAAEHLLDLAACHEEGTPRSALDGSVVEHEALQFEQIDGTRLQLHVKSVPIRGSNGQVRFGMSVFEDITERIKAQTERLHGQKLESVGQLAAGIAHEINTPMQYIGDNTEFL
ncbi:MAG: PAS domain S-box-containing protein, partial [Myxococcota bacterium]